MNAVRAIVTATDLSASSRHAAQRAALLARASGASLTLMHALAEAEPGKRRRWFADDDGEGVNASQAGARECLAALAAELSQHHDIEVAPRLSIGSLLEQIVRHADDTDADLLVTGTRGAGFLRSALIGSTAERIARRSSRPVLMVRQQPVEPYRRVLLPVDFSPWSRGAIELAQRLAPKASLLLMHVVELPYEGKLRLAGVAEPLVKQYRDAALQQARQRLHELAASAGLDSARVQLSTPSGADPWMVIVREAQAQDCDLVVIGRMGRHALDEFLLGSTTRTVVAEGSTDVLIANR